MAEVLGTVSAITGIISFGLSTVNKIYDFSQSFKNAPAAIARLADDTKLTNDALLSLKEMLEKNENRISNESIQSISKASENCRDIFIGIENALSKASKKFPDAQASSTKPELSTWERSKWPMKESQLREYQWQLSNAKINLLFILNIHLCAPNIRKESVSDASVEERAEAVLKSLMKEYLKQLKESPVHDIEEAFDKINIDHDQSCDHSTAGAPDMKFSEDDSEKRSIGEDTASTLINRQTTDSSLSFGDLVSLQNTSSIGTGHDTAALPIQTKVAQVKDIKTEAAEQRDRSVDGEDPKAFWLCLRDAKAKSWGKVERVPDTQATYLLKDLNKALDRCHKMTRATLSADLERTFTQLDSYIEDVIRQHCYQHMYNVLALAVRHTSRGLFSRKKPSNVEAVQFATEPSGHPPRAWHLSVKHGYTSDSRELELNIRPPARDLENAIELQGSRTLRTDSDEKLIYEHPDPCSIRRRGAPVSDGFSYVSDTNMSVPDLGLQYGTVTEFPVKNPTMRTAGGPIIMPCASANQPDPIDYSDEDGDTRANEESTGNNDMPNADTLSSGFRHNADEVDVIKLVPGDMTSPLRGSNVTAQPRTEFPDFDSQAEQIIRLLMNKWVVAEEDRLLDGGEAEGATI